MQQEIVTHAFKLFATFPDQQTIAQSYVISVLAKIPYRVGLDVITTSLDAVERGTYPFIDWTSAFSDGVNSLSRFFCKTYQAAKNS